MEKTALPLHPPVASPPRAPTPAAAAAAAAAAGRDDDDRAARERQERAVPELPQRRRACGMDLRPDDSAVLSLLRSVGEPIPLFGERERERRDLLGAVMVAREAESGVSNDDRAALERHEGPVQERLRAHATDLPTDDSAVRSLLRSLRQPVTLFGEREMERGDRLAALMVALESEPGVSNDNRAAQERHERPVQERLRTLVADLTTDDSAVRSLLGALGEPVTLFGEREVERRDRLAALVVSLEAESGVSDDHRAERNERSVQETVVDRILRDRRGAADAEQIQYPSEGDKDRLSGIFHFEVQPNDLQLVISYLKRYVQERETWPYVHEVDLYETSPQNLTPSLLPAIARDGERCWLVLTHVRPHRGSAVRKVRNIEGHGRWQGDRSASEIRDGAGVLHGFRQGFSFAKVDSNNRKKSQGWRMVEYTLPSALRGEDTSLVLCKIYTKPAASSQAPPGPAHLPLTSSVTTGSLQDASSNVAPPVLPQTSQPEAAIPLTRSLPASMGAGKSSNVPQSIVSPSPPLLQEHQPFDIEHPTDSELVLKFLQPYATSREFIHVADVYRMNPHHLTRNFPAVRSSAHGNVEAWYFFSVGGRGSKRWVDDGTGFWQSNYGPRDIQLRSSTIGQRQVFTFVKDNTATPWSMLEISLAGGRSSQFMLYRLSLNGEHRKRKRSPDKAPQHPIMIRRRGADGRRHMMLAQLLTSEAIETLSRIALVRPDRARFVEAVVLRAAQGGGLSEKVSKERLISLLEQINTHTSKQTKVTVDQDPELEAIRQRRMQELMGQRGAVNPQNAGQQKAQEEAKRKTEERRQMMLTQILSSEASERLSRIALVNPDKAGGVEDVVLRDAQTGGISEKVSKERLTSLLDQINTHTCKQTKAMVSEERVISLLEQINTHTNKEMMASSGIEPEKDMQFDLNELP